VIKTHLEFDPPSVCLLDFQMSHNRRELVKPTSPTRPRANSSTNRQAGSHPLQPLHVAQGFQASVLVTLAGIALLAYSNSFSAGFPLDNKALILQDTRVHAVTSENIDRILNHSYWWPIGESGLYRPITTLSYLLNYAVLGNADRPLGYHVVNLLLHIANVLLVYGIAMRLLVTDRARTSVASEHTLTAKSAKTTGRGWFSFIEDAPLGTAAAAAAVWAVHPLSTEAVTNIVGRADLLAALSVLGGLLLYIRTTDTMGALRVWLLAALGATTAIGVFSKESAVVVVLLAAAYQLCFWSTDASHLRPLPARARDLFGARGFGRALMAMTPALLLVWYQRTAVLGSAPTAEFPFVDNPIVGAGFWSGRWTAIVVMARYLRLVVWPVHLSADYSYAQIPLATGTIRDWIATGTIALAAVGCLFLWRRARTAFFLALFALLTFLPASNLLFPTGTIMAERVMYLPLVGIVGFFAIAIRTLADRFFRPAFAIAVSAAVIVLGARTWMRNIDWHSDLSLWSSAVQAAPRSFKAHRGLAEALSESDPTHANIDQVISEFEQSVNVLDPLSDALSDTRTYRRAAAEYMELGDRLQGSGRHDRKPLSAAAQRAYERSASLLRRSIAIIEAAPGPVKSAAAADANRLLSAVLVRLHQTDQAIATATRARELEPDNAIGYRQSAAAFLAASRNDDAAVTLMTGSMITSDQGLRDELVDLYRRGLDPLNCAITSTANGAAINPSCETVRRHACAATAEAVQIHLRAGRRDEAQRLSDGAARQFQCRAVLSSAS
jgi:protein O-mannosyl-transferase